MHWPQIQVQHRVLAVTSPARRRPTLLAIPHLYVVLTRHEVFAAGEWYSLARLLFRRVLGEHFIEFHNPLPLGRVFGQALQAAFGPQASAL